jgi:hypothetical protein
VPEPRQHRHEAVHFENFSSIELRARASPHRAADPSEGVPTPLDPCLLDLAGTYGDPNVGDPIQYDELRVEHDQGVAEIVVCNRSILLSPRTANR